MSGHQKVSGVIANGSYVTPHVEKVGGVIANGTLYVRRPPCRCAIVWCGRNGTWYGTYVTLHVDVEARADEVGQHAHTLSDLHIPGRA